MRRWAQLLRGAWRAAETTPLPAWLEPIDRAVSAVVRWALLALVLELVAFAGWWLYVVVRP